MTRKIHIRITIGDKIFDLINMIFLTFCLLVVFLPLLNIVSQSFSDPPSVLAGKVIFLPVKPTLASYERIISNSVIISGFANSVLISVLGTLLSVSLTIMAAYPLAKYACRKKRDHVVLRIHNAVQRRFDPDISRCQKSWDDR